MTNPPLDKPKDRRAGRTVHTGTGRPSPRAAAKPAAATGHTSQTPATPLATNTRAIAAKILNEILVRLKPLDALVESDADFLALEPRDRAFVRLMLVTSLRHKGEIDAIIDHRLHKKFTPKDLVGLQLLRLGVAQLLWLKVPPHAAVSATVAAADLSGVPHIKPVINAILRAIERSDASERAAFDGYILNFPDWLRQSWEASYGADLARLIAAQMENDPYLDLSFRPHGATSLAENPLVKTLIADYEGKPLPTGSLRLFKSGRVPELPGFESGDWWVQDAAACLPVQLLGKIEGQRIGDFCAAPGGKTAQLIARGATVVAVDRSASRMARLSENLARLKMTDHAELVTANLEQWQNSEKFAMILLDVPCSATGTLRRHPDIVWLKSPAEITKLTEVQTRLLAAAVARLAVGGILLYCTCSLEAAECEGVIELCLRSHSSLRRIAITAADLAFAGDAGSSWITTAGDLRVLPHSLPEFGGIDGFYTARLTVV